MNGIFVLIDVAAVHNMRVTTRRMRAAIMVFETVFSPNSRRFLKNGFGHVAKKLGTVRDFDVFIEKFAAYQQKFSPNEQAEIALAT